MVRNFFFAAAAVIAAAQVVAGAEIKIPAELPVKVGRLAKLEAKSDGPVRWINLHEDLDLLPDSTGKWAIVIAAKPGRYKVAAYTADKGGPSDPAYCLIIAEGPSAPPPPPPPGPSPKPESKANAIAATVQLRIGNAGCTATIVGPRREDGRWDVLTAAHCSGAAAKTGSITLKDGRQFTVELRRADRAADLLWMTTRDAVAEMPFANLAREIPAVGAKVWHNGYGFDKPGNRESGAINRAVNSSGQLGFRLSVSNGDSGGGIFLEETDELVGVVCCTTRIAGTGDVFGGASTVAARMRGEVQMVHPILFFGLSPASFRD